MRKIILRCWLVNLLVSIVLFVFYRIAIIETEPIDTTLLGRILYIIDILGNLGFSIIYFVVMVFGSLSFFLNLIEKIKNNYLLSFLTFSGIPFVCIVFLVINISWEINPLKMLLAFSIIYLLCTVIEFLMFRIKIKKTVVRVGY